MEKETVQKIEETTVKLLDWIQEQVNDGVVCMEDPHPLPEMVNAVAKLIETLKDIGEKFEGQPPIGGFVKPETLVNKDYKSPYYGAGLYTGSVTGKIMDEQRIREIVKEELAAHEERLNENPGILGISEEKKKEFSIDVIKAINERMKESTKPSLHV